MYTITIFSKLVGVSVKSLQRWDREGILVPLRTPTNRRMYTQEHLEQVKGKQNSNRQIIAYCRVSSPSQRPELSNQVDAMEQFAIAGGYSVDHVIKEIGGGMNMKRPKLRKLLLDVVSGKVSTIIVAHKDRMARFGYELIEYICDLNGTKIVLANNEKLSPQEEMVSDLMAIVHTFSCRLYGLRRYKKVLKDAISSQD